MRFRKYRFLIPRRERTLKNCQMLNAEQTQKNDYFDFFLYRRHFACSKNTMQYKSTFQIYFFCIRQQHSLKRKNTMPYIKVFFIAKIWSVTFHLCATETCLRDFWIKLPFRTFQKKAARRDLRIKKLKLSFNWKCF